MANRWRPIAAAPKDGKPTLLGRAGYGITGEAVGYWTEIGWRSWPGSLELFPTHYRPLPAPPKPRKARP